MSKKFTAIVSATLLVTLFFSACRQNDVNGPTPDTSNSQPAKETVTEKATEKETTTSPKYIVIEPTETEAPTDPVSDPTRASTTVKAPIIFSSIYSPRKIIFYSDGKLQTLTKEMNDVIIKEINNALCEVSWGVLKLAVDERFIENIKENYYCIELYYDSTQTIHKLHNVFYSASYGPYTFEKLLIVLNGDYENVIFFEKDGEYRSGPVKPSKSHFAEKILQHIFDE